MRKIVLPLIFTVFFIPVAILIWSIDIRQESMVALPDRFSFTVQGGDIQQSISIWSEEGEIYYVFLPSYAGLSDTSLLMNTGTRMFLNGKPLTGDYDFSALELGAPYQLSYPYDGETRTVQLVFLQSTNVATMYIRTESGSMDKIHADKSYKENAGIVLMDAEGRVEYTGGGYDKISGRGNATWNSSKKPYIIQLREDSTMLGMTAAKKWILQANSTDVSNIRNKLVYDFAEKTNLYWTPDCEYVDLYLNDEYAGLYLLTEKIEVSENRLDLDESAYLFAIESAVSEKNMNNHFTIESGIKIEITNPSNLTEQETDDFHAYIQSVEDLILDGSRDLFEKIDLDSWVRKYLIEEIFINSDAGLNSQYFYQNKRFTGKIFAGPIWDYDNTIGNQTTLAIQNPRCFFASKAHQLSDYITPWYAALYGNEIFYKRITEIYQDEYLSILDDLIDYDISALSDSVEQAVISNNIRWANLFKGRRTFQEDVQYIQNFLKERTEFLGHAWIDGTPYYTLQTATTYSGRYLFFNLESGKPADSLPSPKELGISDSEVWYINGTDTVFDVTEPVTSDLVLHVQSASDLEEAAKAKAKADEEAAKIKAEEAKIREAENAAKAKAKAEEERARAEEEANRPIYLKILTKIKNNIKILISIGTLFAFMLTLLVMEWRKNWRWEGKVGGRQGRTKVPS